MSSGRRSRYALGWRGVSSAPNLASMRTREAYAAFSPTHTGTKAAHRSAITGQSSSLSRGGTATSPAEKPLFPALSAVDVKI